MRETSDHNNNARLPTVEIINKKKNYQQTLVWVQAILTDDNAN